MPEVKVDMEQLLDHVQNDKPISIARMHEWLKHLVGERDAMLEALSFYADESTYDIDHLDKHGYIIIDMDGGQRARDCIAKLVSQ